MSTSTLRVIEKIIAAVKFAYTVGAIHLDKLGIATIPLIQFEQSCGCKTEIIKELFHRKNSAIREQLEKECNIRFGNIKQISERKEIILKLTGDNISTITNEFIDSVTFNNTSVYYNNINDKENYANNSIKNME